MKTTKMSFVNLRQFMVDAILKTAVSDGSASWIIADLRNTWEALTELYNDESLFWYVLNYTQCGVRVPLSDDLPYKLMYRITRVGKYDYEVEEFKGVD